MTLADYFAACAAHDWWFEMSDDHSVWQRGRAQQIELSNARKGNPLLTSVWDAWFEYKFNRGPAPELSAFDTSADSAQMSILDPH
jgi:hypothetical protein